MAVGPSPIPHRFLDDVICREPVSYTHLDVYKRQVVNQQPALGISHSLILGLREAMAENPDLKGVLFAVCDQPELKADTISRLLRKAQENPGKIVCAGRNGRPGNPVVWDQRYFKELLGLAGDTGGRQVMKNYPGDIMVLAQAEEELRDIDRKEDMTE